MIGLFTKQIQTKNLKIMFNMYFLVTGFFLLSFVLAVLSILQEIIIIIFNLFNYRNTNCLALSTSTLIPNSDCLLHVYIQNLKKEVKTNDSVPCLD